MGKRRKNTLKKFRQDEEGAVIILVAFMLVVILLMLAFALDYGFVYYKKAQLQNAVDIASRATSRVLLEDVDKTDAQKEADCLAAAKKYMKLNGISDEDIANCDFDFIVHNDVEDGVTNTTTEVVINGKSSADLYFGKVLNVGDKIGLTSSGTAVTDYTQIDGKKMTVDVALVLDISGSMYINGVANNKLKPMIEDVNEAMDKIWDENPENRISVTVYSGSDKSETIFKLQKRPAEKTYQFGVKKMVTETVYVRTEGEWVYKKVNKKWQWVWEEEDIYENRQVEKTFYYTYQNASATNPVYIGYYLTSGNSNGLPMYVGTTESVMESTSSGGTFTQMGIYLGAQTLMNSTATTYIDEDGVEQVEKRIPSMFIFSDGEATYANTNYRNAITSKNLGTGNAGTTADNKDLHKVGYYTVLTACYWKNKISDYYTNKYGQISKALFYTMGFATDDLEYKYCAVGVLDPKTLDSVTFDTEAEYVYDRWGRVQSYGANYKPAYELKLMLQKTEDPYYINNEYFFSDKYYSAESGSALRDQLNQFANDVVAPSKSYNTHLTK